MMSWSMGPWCMMSEYGALVYDVLEYGILVYDVLEYGALVYVVTWEDLHRHRGRGNYRWR